MIPSTTLLALALLSPQGAPASQDRPTQVQRLVDAMGTRLSIQVDAPTRREALDASEAALRAIEGVEQRLSTWTETSELSRLNATPVGRPFAAGPALRDDLEQAAHWWRETDGAFDPAVGALVRAWGLRTGGRVPGDAELERAIVADGFGALQFTDAGLVRTDERLAIEEGGFGKGVGLAAAVRALGGTRATRATLDLGGQVVQVGGGDARFAVADPRHRDREVLAVTIPAGSLATSGNSERGIVVDGVRYGHLLDPRSGRPVPDFGSVTVWAPDPVAADCLSTAAYVIGPEAALALGRRLDGVEVLVLQPDGATLRARGTSGFGERVEVLTSDVVLELTLDVAEPVPAAAIADPPPSDDRAALAKLEARDTELERRIDAVAGEVERLDLGDVLPVLGESRFGMGPAASKVYATDAGHVSIGGYGEMLYQNFDSEADDGSSSGETDRADFERAVLYFGYKFDDRWLFNSEIEYEHGSTEEGGSVSMEFAYLDYLADEAINARAGLLLQPMGLTNEMHEPTTFPSTKRPGVESVILPSTWREAGVGVFGELGEFDYKLYLTAGLEAAGFSADEGLREGRQQGAESLAEDLAVVGRVDWTGRPGLLIGGSTFIGDSGQDLGVGADVPTSIWEVHADWRWRGLRVRALHAAAELDDVSELNAAEGLVGMASVGERMAGHYVEVGYDVMQWLRPGSPQSLTPFVRYEAYDTQAAVPSGFMSDPANDVEIRTYGVAWQPIDQVIFKLDYLDVDNGAGTGVDQVDFGVGYGF